MPVQPIQQVQQPVQPVVNQPVQPVYQPVPPQVPQAVPVIPEQPVNRIIQPPAPEVNAANTADLPVSVPSHDRFGAPSISAWVNKIDGRPAPKGEDFSGFDDPNLKPPLKDFSAYQYSTDYNKVKFIIEKTSYVFAHAKI